MNPRLFLFVTLAACTGTIGEADPLVDYRPELPDERPMTPEARRCDTPGSSSHLLRRLTPEQYEAAVTRIFEGVNLGNLLLPEVVADKNGYANDATRAAPIATTVDRFHDVANQIASAVSADRRWLDCTLETEGCLEQTVFHVAEAAFRRPLSDEQRTIFTGFLAAESAREAQDTLSLAIQAILESPEFLYVPESGDSSLAAPEGMRALTHVELVGRMALLLWDEPADEALVIRAGELDLSDDATLDGLVDEMVADARVNAGLERFAAQWMPLRPGEYGGSLARNSMITSSMRDDLRLSALRFLRYAFLEAGSLDELLTSRIAFVNDNIAPIFGVDAPGSTELVQVMLPESERSGILTHPAVLSVAPADATFYSVYRGVFVMNQLLCIPPGLPQFDTIDVTEGTESGTTNRERLEGEHLSAECNICHETIDGVGFAFNNFDPSGVYRTTEFGAPVDASGRVFDIDVADAIEFTEVLSQQEEVRYCVTEHFYRYAMANGTMGDEDLCQVQHLADSLGESDDGLGGIARALVMSNSFRYIPEAGQ